MIEGLLTIFIFRQNDFPKNSIFSKKSKLLLNILFLLLLPGKYI